MCQEGENRQRFPILCCLILVSLCKLQPQFAVLSLTGVGPSLVFCFRLSALSLDILCIQRCSSVFLGCNKSLFEFSCLPIISKQSSHSPLTWHQQAFLLFFFFLFFCSFSDHSLEILKMPVCVNPSWSLISKKLRPVQLCHVQLLKSP